MSRATPHFYTPFSAAIYETSVNTHKNTVHKVETKFVQFTQDLKSILSMIFILQHSLNYLRHPFLQFL